MLPRYSYFIYYQMKEVIRYVNAAEGPTLHLINILKLSFLKTHQFHYILIHLSHTLNTVFVTPFFNFSGSLLCFWVADLIEMAVQPEVEHPRKAYGWAARDTSGVLSPFLFSRRSFILLSIRIINILNLNFFIVM